MIGIVLAAGDATRLPNKLMLGVPGRRQALLIDDAICYCLRHCSKVIIVVKNGSVVKRYIDQGARQKDHIKVMWQPQPSTGVVDAISAANVDEDILVTFGDCFGYSSLPLPPRNHATVVFGQQPGLDGFSGTPGAIESCWVDRQYERKFSFSGCVRFDKWTPFGHSLMGEFNRHMIKPFACDGVQDCGTQEGYEKIWRS